MRFPRLFLGAFVLALGLLAFVAALNLRHKVRVQESAAWVARTHEVQAGLNRLLSLVEEIETGSHGFVVTGVPVFLGPFHHALGIIADQQRRLETEIHDEAQRASFAYLARLIAERIADAQALVELRQTVGFDAARNVIATGRGADLMTQIRDGFARMEAVQRHLLAERSGAAQRKADQDEWLAVAGGGSSAALFIVAVALLMRENRLRQRAEFALQEANEHLEQRVRDRTTELETANEALRREIGERARVERDLAAERTLLRTVIDMLPDHVYVKDRESRFIAANAACAYHMGVASVRDLLGKSDVDFYSPEEAARFRADELTALAGTSVIDKEEIAGLSGSARRLLLTTKAPLRDNEGNIVGVVGIGRDVTARKTAENAIRQLNTDLERRVKERTAQLEAANQELESFSYSVSHDLRAPLRHIQGFVELLQRATEGQLDEKPRRFLKVISEASVQMGQLIDDLLAFSQMGRVEMTETCVHLDGLLRETMRVLELPTNGRNIAWKVAPLPDVHGDSAMLRQVLANLVGNAVKYTRGREPAEIEIGCARGDNGWSTIFVRDNGAGFDMKYAHKLFGVFQRLHRAEEFEGTGIGLATVRRVVARHGGRVWAEAEVGKGATFYFTLKNAVARMPAVTTQDDRHLTYTPG